ncbi:hypothetical protein BDY19DRAFT_630916 [Irpex rosettiformis]|uniref:Uncharacterized protein n=1 Tax=Irpex rosettiformis TaxID=378272 RepID=A0ACB8UBB8_9APHY|nr:hypothetical protein BDY19DRAFT_630916 [Irpex rosettiformis]
MVNLSFRQLLPRALSRKTSPHRTNNPDDEERPQRGVYLDDGSSGKTPPRLPVELFLKIFEHLGVVDILRCRSACKHFQNVIDHSPEMQYMIELHAAGYVDNPLCTGMGSTARREALKKEARFWRNPKGTWRRTDFPWSVSYEDMRNTNWDDNLWVRFKRNFGAEEGKWNGLQCVAFQPVEGGTPVAERWELTFPFSFVCVSGNPSESMVVLLDLETDPVSSVNENYIIWKVAVRDGTVLSRQTVRFECAPNPGWAEPEISVKGNGVTITRVTHPGVVNAHAHITVLDLETCSYTYVSCPNTRSGVHSLTPACRQAHV